MADRFREGSAFLVGDAAHRVTPRGGTGMNAALQSGADLGWKLAWVLQGWAGAELLDTYEVERRPVVAHHLARSLDPDGSRRRPEDELPVDLGPRIAHVWLPSTSGQRSTLDLLGPGWTLFTGPTRGTAYHGAATAPPSPALVALRELDTVTAHALGVLGDGALLARPDGVPARRWVSPARAAAEFGTVIELGAGTGRTPVRGAA